MLVFYAVTNVKHIYMLNHIIEFISVNLTETKQKCTKKILLYIHQQHAVHYTIQPQYELLLYSSSSFFL